MPEALVSLTHMEAHAVHISGLLWSSLTAIAESYLCKVARYQRDQHGPICLRLQGRAALAAEGEIARQLRETPPEGVFANASASFPRLAVERIRATLEREGQLAFAEGDESVWVTIHAETNTVLVRAVSEGRVRGKGQRLNAAQQGLNRIRLWLRLEGYDKVYQCASCADDYNREDICACPGGHHFCTDRSGSGDDCFTHLLNAARDTIKGSNGDLLCPLCQVPFETQEIAEHVSKDTWVALATAVADARGAKAHAQLQLDFEERVRQKMDELEKDYANADAHLTLKARTAAAKARDTVLNLMCPDTKCAMAYAEFDGCMALQCASCKAHFCAYCHKLCADSRGAHQHVRECDMNLSLDGSYYATPEVIKDAQRRFRVKELKHFVRSYKTSQLQSAIVLELAKDLKDLGIPPGAILTTQL